MTHSILGRYLLKHYLKFFLLFFLIFFLLAFLLNLTTLIGQSSGQLSQIAFISLLKMPFLLQKLLPFIVLFSAMAHFIVLNKNSELLIIRASGLSLWQFSKSASLCALIVGFFSIFLLNPLSFWCAKIENELLFSSLKRGASLNLSKDLYWFTDTIGDETRTIGTKTFINDGKSLIDTRFIITSQNDNNIIWIKTNKADLKNGYWFIKEGTLYQSGNVAKILKNYKIKTKIKADFIKERLQNPEKIPFYQLSQAIEKEKLSGGNGDKALATLYTLVTFPFFLVAMVLTAAMLSLNFSRLEQKNSLLFSGLLCGFIFYTLTTTCQNLGKTGNISPLAAAFIPVLFAFFVSITVLLYKEER